MAFGPKVKLTRNASTGFAMVETIEELIRQNLTTLILTSPGERVMTPNYGVGLNQFLFENMAGNVYSNIENAIRNQAGQYLPGVSIDIVRFFKNEDNNSINLQVSYSVPNLGINSSVTLAQNQATGFSSY